MSCQRFPSCEANVTLLSSLLQPCLQIHSNFGHQLVSRDMLNVRYFHNRMIAKGKGKGKGPFYLTSVVPSVLQLRETAINGSRRCALYPPCHCQCSVLRVFKAIATRIRGKSKQTLKSLKIEPGTSRSVSRALAN